MTGTDAAVVGAGLRSCSPATELTAAGKRVLVVQQESVPTSAARRSDPSGDSSSWPPEQRQMGI